MKQGIHPEYVDCVVKCSCGNTFTTRSTKPELKIDICNACHPFYTGTQKLIDTGGRVQRFADRFGSAKDVVAEREAAKKAERAAKIAEQEAAKKAEREAKAAAKAERAAAYAAKAAEEAARAEVEEQVQDMADAAAADTAEEAPGVELTDAEVTEAVEAAE
ncbi:50S ribosomal protein L31 [uncultured Adlercreutzia sp.]|uniref:50S ribosomal protein L31 n=1 Tax=uncultured Adlercreutzia sp. TaxID=875803 RepID=UPI0025D0B47D|nr:50S ribosomal protein L31 [uncultured Adlercreutzia sp.]